MYLLGEMFSVSTSKSVNTTVSSFVNFPYHNRSESLQYKNFCMCSILVLTYLSAPLVSPICTHFEVVLISHSVPSTSCSQSGSNISPKIQSFLSLVSHNSKSYSILGFGNCLDTCNKTIHSLLHSIKEKVSFITVSL